MATVQLTGHIDAAGRLEISEHIDLPPGDVIITIAPVSAENDDDDEFDKLLASPKSLVYLDQLFDEAWAAHDAGLTDELDPKTLNND